MRILRVTTGYPPKKTFGPAMQAERLTSILSSRGHECTILTVDDKFRKGAPVELRNGYRILWCNSIARFGSFHLSPSVIRASFSERADIIHLHELRSFQNEVVARAATLRGIPYLLTSHGSVTGSYDQAQSWREMLPYLAYDFLSSEYVIKRARMVVASCESEARRIREFGISSERICVIPHGVDPPQNLDVLRLMTCRDSRPTVLFVGRLSRARNIPMLLLAMYEVRLRIPNLRLVLCGSFAAESYMHSDMNYQRTIQLLIEELRLRDAVEFKGWISGDDLWREYLSADVFAWPSTHDNFGHALVESAICGLPIVSTPVGVAPELIGSNRGGYLVRHGDATQMATCVLKLLGNESERQSAGAHVEKAARNYSAQTMASLYEKLYNDLLQ